MIKEKKKYTFIPIDYIRGVPVTIIQKSLFKKAFGDNLDIQQKECDSMLGTPVYDSFTFGNLNNENSNVYIDILGVSHTYKPLRLHDVLLEVNQTKVITQTAVQGRNGTVKQYICDGDYNIFLSGYISGKYNSGTHTWAINGSNPPNDAIELLINICKIGNTLNVTSSLLSIFGIDQIVITDFSIPQRSGQGNRQYFEINMISDNDFILEFEQEDVDDLDKLKTILGV